MKFLEMGVFSNSKPNNNILLALYLRVLVFVAFPVLKDFLDITSGIEEKLSTVLSTSRNIDILYKDMQI